MSDLAVHVKHRRKGIATSLIQACERMVIQRATTIKRELYMHLRVERDNEAALRMYALLGYQPQISDVFGVIDTTILLKRVFNPPPGQ